MTPRTTPDTQELDALEAHLAGTLKPVSPSREILSRVGERIRMPAHEEIKARLRNWNSLFFVFGGVMSGMLLIITVARALFYLFGRRNV